MDSFYTLSMDKNKHFLTPSPLHLVHVVIECPLAVWTVKFSIKKVYISLLTLVYSLLFISLFHNPFVSLFRTRLKKNFNVWRTVWQKIGLKNLENWLNAITNTGYELRAITGNGNDVDMLKVHWKKIVKSQQLNLFCGWFEPFGVSVWQWAKTVKTLME